MAAIAPGRGGFKCTLPRLDAGGLRRQTTPLQLAPAGCPAVQVRSRRGRRWLQGPGAQSRQLARLRNPPMALRKFSISTSVFFTSDE